MYANKLYTYIYISVLLLKTLPNNHRAQASALPQAAQGANTEPFGTSMPIV